MDFLHIDTNHTNSTYHIRNRLAQVTACLSLNRKFLGGFQGTVRHRSIDLVRHFITGTVDPKGEECGTGDIRTIVLTIEVFLRTDIDGICVHCCLVNLCTDFSIKVVVSESARTCTTQPSSTQRDKIGACINRVGCPDIDCRGT